MNSIQSKIASGIFLLVVVFITVGIFTVSRTAQTANALDAFAQCLTEKGFTMYGAYWCPHCQNEKAAFGDSFRSVNYVECTKEPDRCVAADISGYPTWITNDGRRFEGEQGVQKLSQESGCSLEPISK